MGRLHKNVKKYSLGSRAAQSIVGKENYDSAHLLGSSAEAAYDANKASEKAITEAENQPVIPLPDEEAIERVKRRRSRRGGRASTVLTGDDERYGG